MAKADNFQYHDYYMVDELLTDEQKLIRESARAWVKKEVSPVVEDACQKAQFPSRTPKEARYTRIRLSTACSWQGRRMNDQSVEPCLL